MYATWEPRKRSSLRRCERELAERAGNLKQTETKRKDKRALGRRRSIGRDVTVQGYAQVFKHKMLRNDHRFQQSRLSRNGNHPKFDLFLKDERKQTRRARVLKNARFEIPDQHTRPREGAMRSATPIKEKYHVRGRASPTPHLLIRITYFEPYDWCVLAFLINKALFESSEGTYDSIRDFVKWLVF